MFIRMLAAALNEPLGSPSVVSLSDAGSLGKKGGTAGFTFGSNGAIYTYHADTPIVTGYWLAPIENTGDYEIRATLSSGTTPDTGTLDTWETLDELREWTLASASVGVTLTAVLLIEIRWTGDNVVRDSATYTLTGQGPLS